MEKIYKGNALIKEPFGGIEITIPASKNWFLLLFLCVWSTGWFFGETSVIKSLWSITSEGVNFGTVFGLFWLCGWTLGGFLALSTVVWLLAGKEILRVDKGVLIIEKKAMLFIKPKAYAVKDIKEFVIAEDEFFDSTSMKYGMPELFTIGKRGALKFDYGFKTIRFANGIDKVEAKFILDKLKTKIGQ
jgi:hypothetical protein